MVNLILGEDSYVTLEEANEYVEKYYSKDTEEYQLWFSESYKDSDKEANLRNSAMAINNLQYRGAKKHKGQPLAFPRKVSSYGGLMYTPFVSQYYDNTLVSGFSDGDGGLRSAKKAQIENVLAFKLLGQASVNTILQNQTQSLRSRRAGSITETYGSPTGTSDAVLQGIYNKDKIYYILNAWITKSIQSL